MAKRMIYTINKTYDKITHEEIWYCHKVGFSYVPVFGSLGDKQHARKYADMMNASCGVKGDSDGR